MNGSTAPWAEVDLGAVAWNTCVIRRRLQPDAQLLVAVKSNGYGHGAVEVARTCLRHGATALGVARLEEGIALREEGLAAPVLIFGPTPVDGVDELLRHGLTPTVTDVDDAARLAGRVAKGQRLPVHLKIDTGMGRLGSWAQPGPEGAIDPQRAWSVAREAAAIAALPGLHLQGVFTHFSCADHSEGEPTQAQYRAFVAVLDALSQLGVRPPVRHAANSAAIFRHPETHLDQARAGIAVYGYGVPREAGLRVAMTLKTRIVQLRRVPVGTTVSYGMTHRTKAPAILATVALGYGDGYAWAHSSQGRMLVRGYSAPVVGRVCMDLTMLDVSHVPGVAEGDEVVAFGRQGNAELPADVVGGAIGTIPHEVLTSLTARVRRVYTNETGAAANERAA